jgi:hypothetical protein
VEIEISAMGAFARAGLVLRAAASSSAPIGGQETQAQ